MLYGYDGQASGHGQSQANSSNDLRLKTMPRLLIVEDDGALRYDMAGMISSWGYEVRTASAGLQAVAIIKDWLPHLVLSDINMPHVNGIELFSYIKKVRPENAIISFFLISSPSARNLSNDIGADNFLSKPIDYKLLKQAIENHFSNQINKMATVLMNGAL